MNIKYYVNNPTYLAGVTLKDQRYKESNNMALHASENIEDVLSNRQQFADELQIPLEQVVCANQTHSENFHRVTKQDAGRGAMHTATAIPNTDALYTYESNILLCSFTADCVPVLFYHETNGLIGAVHSGWQGTVKEITLKLFNHLKHHEVCDLTKIHVQIGLAISQNKFEVDEDVYLKFKQLGYADDFMYFNKVTKKYHIDNQQVVKKQCELAGIPSHQITIDPTCTFKAEEGFSYRENRQCGRHLSFIIRKD